MDSHSPKSSKLSPPSSSTTTTQIPNHLLLDDFYKKTQLCRKFSEGFCTFGSKCKYAHGIAELKPRRQQQHQLCRMFLHNKQCSYGPNCRFIHVNANPNISHGSQPQQEKVDGYSSAKYTTMQTSTAATNVSTSLQKNEPSTYISPREIPQLHPEKYRVMQTSDAATNASSPGSSLHKYVENGVTKFIFKNNDIQKIKGIYGDWI